jgi:hypothetical protein
MIILTNQQVAKVGESLKAVYGLRLISLVVKRPTKPKGGAK